MTGRSTTVSTTAKSLARRQRAQCKTIPRQLWHGLTALDPTAMCRSCDDGAALPATAGAYVLVIRLDRPASLTIRNRPMRMEPGWHLYAGSAYGPGGVRARLLRHFKDDKKVHWHVDHLTLAGRVASALVFADGNECEIAQRLAYVPAVDAVYAGFGSSDCGDCATHLLSCRPAAISLRR